MLRVFLASASFKLEQGGPAYSVGRLAGALAANGHKILVWAPDGSATRALELDPSHTVMAATGDLSDALASQSFDVVHDNGLWVPYGARLARACETQQIPRLLSIRGMMQPWAWQHRRWKKRIAWALYQRRAVTSAALLHATSHEEVACVAKQMPGRTPVLIANGIDVPEAAAAQKPAIHGTRTALFLGRLHPVKGLPLLVEAWRAVRPEGWRLQIVGPGDDGYRADLARQVAAAGLVDQISISGAVSGAAKDAHYHAASLFILPSHTENFGISIAEAMAHAVPVITTTGTPWQVLRDDDMGWWVPTDSDNLAAALASATTLPASQLDDKGQRSRQWVAGHLHWPAIAKQFADAYADILAHPQAKY